MDVPFRGVQRQHDRLYVAALNDPSAEGLASQINFQTYAGRDLSDFVDWGLTGVCTCWAIDAEDILQMRAVWTLLSLWENKPRMQIVRFYLPLLLPLSVVSQTQRKG